MRIPNHSRNHRQTFRRGTIFLGPWTSPLFPVDTQADSTGVKMGASIEPILGQPKRAERHYTALRSRLSPAGAARLGLALVGALGFAVVCSCRDALDDA